MRMQIPTPNKDKFGRLTFIGIGTPAKCGTRKLTTWNMKCDCGALITANANRVKRKQKLSCGCLYKETRKTIGVKHGYRRTEEYRILMGAISRCSNPKDKSYVNYGGRGIKVCREWMENPALFIEHIGLRPTKDHQIERINNDGNYEPGNVRWATRSEQHLNKRRVYTIKHNGRVLTTKQYCKEIGLSYHTYQHRVKRGLSREDALSLEDGRTKFGWETRRRKAGIKKAKTND